MRSRMSLEGYKYLLAVGNPFCHICGIEIPQYLRTFSYVIPSYAVRSETQSCKTLLVATSNYALLHKVIREISREVA